MSTPSIDFTNLHNNTLVTPLSIPLEQSSFELCLFISTTLESLEIKSNSKIQEVWGVDYLGSSSVVDSFTENLCSEEGEAGQETRFYITELKVDPAWIPKECVIKFLSLKGQTHLLLQSILVNEKPISSFLVDNKEKRLANTDSQETLLQDSMNPINQEKENLHTQMDMLQQRLNSLELRLDSKFSRIEGMLERLLRKSST